MSTRAPNNVNENSEQWEGVDTLRVTVPKRSEGGRDKVGDGITERSFHQRVQYKSLNQIEKFPNLVGDEDDDYGTFYARAYVCAKCVFFFREHARCRCQVDLFVTMPKK